MNLIKIINIIILGLLTCCNINSCNDDNKSERKDEIIKKYQYDRHNIESVERMINIIIQDKKRIMSNLNVDIANNNTEMNQKILGEITEKLIEDLRSFQTKGIDIKRVLKNYLILYQYIEVYNEEYLSEICRSIFVENQEIVINCLINIDKYLLDEFRNKEFKNELYVTVCDLPSSIYEEKNIIEKKKTEIKRKLISIRKDKNKDIIDIILKQNFN